LLKNLTIGCEVKLVDDNDNEVADGIPGEVAFRGPTLFSGYVNNPKANDECFRCGWHHMGDVMVKTPGTGTLQFVDRLKYLIKSGGENIYPAEIERALIRDRRIDEVSVVRSRDKKWGEVPVAFVARNDVRLTEAEVIALCDGLIARYKYPKRIIFINNSEFPRGSTGKIKRDELEAQLLSNKK
jgi:fatty-acyl-CoA synthase